MNTPKAKLCLKAPHPYSLTDLIAYSFSWDVPVCETSLLIIQELSDPQGSFDSSYSSSSIAKKQYFVSILTDGLVRYICRSINCAQGKRSLHWR